MMETKQLSSQSNQLDSTIIYPADYDYKVLEHQQVSLDNDTDHVSVGAETSQIDNVDSYHDQIQLIWTQIGELISQGRLDNDHPLLQELVNLLQQIGIIPTDGLVTDQSLLHFHQWFNQMQSPLFSNELTHLEGQILYQWAALNNDGQGVDQVIVFDALNAFQQYVSYSQIILDGTVYTLSYHHDGFIHYDAHEHSAFGIIFNHQWVEPMPDGVDYQNAHTYLALSDQDRAAIDQWLSQLFPNGYSDMSDDAIITSLINGILQSDHLTYQVDILDEWSSVSDFLGSGVGDCEEFSHLFYSAIQQIFDQLPDRQSPNVSVIAGMVGSGFSQIGHSLIEIEFNDQVYVLDLSAGFTSIQSVSDLSTYDDYQINMNFQELLRYTTSGTQIQTDDIDLDHFSTSTNYDNQLEQHYQLIFGQNASFSSVTSVDDSAYTISDYNSLIQKVIGLEMVQLIESGNTGYLNSIVLNDLAIFELTFSLNKDSQFIDFQFDIEDFLLEQWSQTKPISAEVLNSEFGINNGDALLQELVNLNYLVQVSGNYYVDYPNHQTSISDQDIWMKLLELGFIDEYGMVNTDAVNNPTLIATFTSYLEDNGLNEAVTNRVVALLEDRSYVFSDVSDTTFGDDHFENTLRRFDMLSEEIFTNLTAATTPIYSTNPSPYVIGSYDQSSDSNSLFVRIDHKKLQEAMSLFFTIQNTISAFLSVYFSISDMVSSIAAKLGDENSVASSTAKQRQKMIQSFNSYTSGLNESVNTLMDLFEKSIEKNNEARYQTAVSQIDYEYSDFFTQLGNEFLSKQFDIEKENLKVKLSQDFYNTQFDNRNSLQEAMLDVPNFGPNLMPNTFSSLLLDSDYGDMTSMQIWASLFANGVIDETGVLVDDVDLESLHLLAIVDDDAYSAFQTFDPSMADDPDAAMRMKLLLNEQNQAFIESWSVLNSDQRSALQKSVQLTLTRHRDSLAGFSMVDMDNFGTSQYLFSYLDMFARVGDQAYSQDTLFSGDLTEDAQRVNFDWNQSIDDYNSYSDGLVNLESFNQFQYNHNITFHVDSDSSFYQYQEAINLYLLNQWSNTNPVSAESLAADIGVDSAAALFSDLIDKGYLVEVSGSYYVDYPEESGFTFELKFSSDFYQYQADINQFLLTKWSGTDPVSVSNLNAYLGISSGDALLQELIDEEYLVEISGNYYVDYPSRDTSSVTDQDIWDVLIKNKIVDSSGAILKDPDFFLGEPISGLKSLYPSYLGDVNADMIYNHLYINSKPNALHLSESAATNSEGGSGFQIVNFDMVSMARKNLMMMNMTKRIYMTMISAYTQFFEKIASKLSRDSTSSSHYGDWQSSLMESHIGLVDRQLSTIQSNTIAMVDRINDLHRHRLNIIKMGDPILRGLDIASDWSGIAGAIFLLSPAPVFQLIGVLLSMASSVLTLAESWRGQYLEEDLDQEMDTRPTGFDDVSSFDDVYQNLNSFFSANLHSSADDDSFSAATDGSTVDSDVMPRSVVDYTNAHQYINPNSSAVQNLLSASIFPDGVPTDPSVIIEQIHAFMNQSATYRPDSAGDHWATVDETALSLTGDCEDLINLEYSLILAAFNQQGISTDSLKANAGYVSTSNGREGHVYLTYDDGSSQPIVLDPSLNTDGEIQTLADYRDQYRVKDVFNYTNEITNISDHSALGIETSFSGEDFFDGIADFFTDTIPNAFLDLFVPDFSDSSAFNGMFSVDTNDSSDQTATQFIGEAVGLLFDNFVDGFDTDIPILSEFGNLSANGIRSVLEPIVLAFSPGNDGYGVVSDISGTIDTLIDTVMGDSFDPDVNFIQQLIYNKLYGGDGSLGFDDSSASDSFDSVIDAIGVDTSEIYDRTSDDFTFFLNAGSLFLDSQYEIEELLLTRWSNTDPVSASDFTFVPEDSRQDLFDELVGYGYLVKVSNNYYVDYPSYSASAGSEASNSMPLNFNSQSGSFSTSAINPGTVQLSKSVNKSLKTDVSQVLNELLQDQEGIVDGFFSQSMLSGSDFSNVMFASDEKGQRVMLNKYNVGGYKDALRLQQERLRSLFLLVKMVSDAISVIAANIGDENKVKVAAGLQKLFESNFDFLSMYMDVQEQLLSHFENANNHNVTVSKTRTERETDVYFKSGLTGITMAAAAFKRAQYGSLIYQAANIIQTIGMYENLFNNNPYSEKFFKSDYFDDSGFLQTVPNNRYTISNSEQAYVYQISDQNNFVLNDTNLSTLALAEYRSQAVEILKEAAATKPIESGGQLTLPWLSHAKTLILDENQFNQYRLRLVELGMQQQKTMLMYISISSYMSSVTKAIRGDGKVGSQHLTATIDIIEREVSHDIEELGRIQSMQESAISLNNQQYSALQKVERSYYEAIFFAGYFMFKKFAFTSMPVLEILTVKALSNMFQGILLSYGNWHKGTDLNRVDNELEEYEQYDSANETNVNASGYSTTGGQSSSINYSGIHNYEDNYLSFGNNRNDIILDSQFSNSDVSKWVGLSFQSVNWFEYARQSMMLKKLFKQWDLMLRSGQTISEAYQNIADELGAVTTSFSYTQALKSQMKLKKGMMSKSVDGLFNLASNDVSRFNTIQSERFETFLQGIKYGLIKAAQSFQARLEKSRNQLSQNGASSLQKTYSQSMDYALYVLISFSENIIRTAAGGIRSSQLQSMQRDSLTDMNEQYRGNFDYGSSNSEAMLYTANFSKAREKVRGDVVGKQKEYQGEIKKTIKNLIDSWIDRAKETGRSLVSGDGSFMNDAKLSFSKSIFDGDMKSVDEQLREVSAFLMESPGKSSTYAKNYIDNFMASLNIFTRKPSIQTLSHGSRYDQLLENSSVWHSVTKLGKEIAKHGDLTNRFQKISDSLKADIIRLHEINEKRLKDSVIAKTDDMIADRLQLLNKISQGFNQLNGIANESDNYEQVKKSPVEQVLRQFSTSRFREAGLGQIANNIDSFCTFGNASYILAANKTRDVQPDKVKQRQLTEMLIMLEEKFKHDPNKKVYQDVSGVMVNLSNHRQSFKGFLKQSFDLKTFLDIAYNPKDIDDATARNYHSKLHEFAKRTLASQEHGHHTIIETLASIAPDQDSKNAWVIEQLSGSNGILQFAKQNNNEKGSKRYAHALNYWFNYGSESKDILSDWVLKKGDNKFLATFLASVDREEPIIKEQKTLYSVSETPYYKRFYWYRHYDSRIKQVIQDSIKKVKSASNDQQRQLYIELLRFGAQLQIEQPNKEFIKRINEICDPQLFERVFGGPPENKTNEFFNALDDKEQLLGTPEGIRLCKMLGLKLDDLQPKAAPVRETKDYTDIQSLKKDDVFSALIYKYNENRYDNQWFKELFKLFPEQFINFSQQIIKDRERFLNQAIHENSDSMPNNRLTIDQLPNQSYPNAFVVPFKDIIASDFSNSTAQITMGQVRTYLQSPLEALAHDQTLESEYSDTIKCQALVTSNKEYSLDTHVIDLNYVDWASITWQNDGTNFVHPQNFEHFQQMLNTQLTQQPYSRTSKDILRYVPNQYLDNTLSLRELSINPELLFAVMDFQPDLMASKFASGIEKYGNVDYIFKYFDSPEKRHQFFSTLSRQIISTDGSFGSDIPIKFYRGMSVEFQQEWAEHLVQNNNSMTINQLMIHLTDSSDRLEFLKQLMSIQPDDLAFNVNVSRLYDSAVFAYLGINYSQVFPNNALNNMDRDSILNKLLGKDTNARQFLTSFYRINASGSRGSFISKFTDDFMSCYGSDARKEIFQNAVQDCQSKLNALNHEFHEFNQQVNINNRFSKLVGFGSYKELAMAYQDQISALESDLGELYVAFNPKLDRPVYDHYYIKFNRSNFDHDTMTGFKDSLISLFKKLNHSMEVSDYQQLPSIISQIKKMLSLLPKVTANDPQFIANLSDDFKMNIRNFDLNLLNKYFPDFLSKDIITDRLKDLQGMIFNRQHGQDYLPVSDIVRQISQFNSDSKALMVFNIFDQSDALIQSKDVVSLPRLLDVVYSVIDSDPYLLEDQTILQSLRKLLVSSLDDQTTQLSDAQKRQFLKMLHYVGIQDEKTTFNSNHFRAIESIIGPRQIYEYIHQVNVNSEENVTTNDSFIQQLQSRLDIFYQQNTNPLAIINDQSDGYVLYYRNLSDDQLCERIKDFVHKDLSSFANYEKELSDVCARYVSQGKTNEVVKAAFDYLESNKGIITMDQCIAIQNLIMKLNDFSYGERKEVFASFVNQCLKKLSAENLKSFLFATQESSNKPIQLTDFQKKLIDEYKQSYIVSKRSIAENSYYLWSSNRAKGSRKKIEGIFDQLFNDSSNVSMKVFEELFFGKFPDAQGMTRDKKERYYQRLIHQVFRRSSNDPNSSFFVQLIQQSSRNKVELHELFAEVAHYFKHKSYSSSLKGMVGGQTSYDSWISKKKDQLNIFIKEIDHKFCENYQQLIDCDLELYNKKSKYQPEIINKMIQNIQNKNKYLMQVRAHLLVSSQTYAGSKSESLEIAQQGLNDMFSLRVNDKSKIYYDKYRDRIDQDFDYFVDVVQDLANLSSVPFIKDALKDLDIMTKQKKSKVDHDLLLPRDQQQRFRKKLVKLDKVKKLENQNQLYDFQKILLNWAKYNRNFENGGRTASFSVGGPPGSLKID